MAELSGEVNPGQGTETCAVLVAKISLIAWFIIGYVVLLESRLVSSNTGCSAVIPNVHPGVLFPSTTFIGRVRTCSHVNCQATYPLSAWLSTHDMPEHTVPPAAIYDFLILYAV